MAWFAHSSPHGTEPLGEHLAGVGDLAADFAVPFSSPDWARAAGLLHDVGKAHGAFLRRLAGDPAKVDHASAGGIAALERLGLVGRLLAYAVVGHHGGLPDAGKLDERLARDSVFDHGAVPELPHLPKPPVDMTGQGAAAFLRMIFSCLVDADFIATERFYDPAAKDRRTIPFDAEPAARPPARPPRSGVGRRQAIPGQ
ncbi:MAG: CRISPR-associated endonuclease Cas3'' [Magnetospirillum sp.]|nr:CRISPR-associated endonuclease Cas3'' [Magnetospirillum sp.]